MAGALSDANRLYLIAEASYGSAKRLQRAAKRFVIDSFRLPMSDVRAGMVASKLLRLLGITIKRHRV